MEVCSRDDSEYRLLIGDRVKYIVVAPGTFDRSTLSMPLDSLPPLPYSEDWTIAHVYRDSTSGELEYSLSQRKLAGVEETWHTNSVDCLKLKRVKQLTGATFESTCDSESKPIPAPPLTVIAKIARFEWEIPRIERETRAYQLLEGSGLAPRFLGHIHEHGRVIGLLLEKTQGREAGIGDLAECRTVLERIHKLGLLHGDVNRYNFVVGKELVTMIDFERSQIDGDESSMRMEIESLSDELTENTGRGGGFRPDS